MVLGSEQQGIVRFYPKKLRDYIPLGAGEGWKNKEAFLFEFFVEDERKITLRATINGNDKESEQLLKKIFSNEKSYLQQVLYNTWTWAFEFYIDYNRDEVLILENLEISEYFEKLYKSFEEFINSISNLILNDTTGSKEELKSIVEKRKSILNQ